MKIKTSQVLALVLLTAMPQGKVLAAGTNVPVSRTNSPPSGGTEAERQYYQHITADSLYDWKQPINFYGLVVDESNQPVVGAMVDYSWTDLSRTGTSDKQCQSDTAGKFEIHERGKRMCITVTGKGYYNSRDARVRGFEFANPWDGLFTPDKANPVVFHLHKAGDIEPLEARYFILILRADDSPIYFDPVRCKLVTNGTVVLSLLKGPLDAHNQTDVRLRITINGGGIQLAEGEFPFLAPEKGYNPSLDITVGKDASREILDRRFNCYFKMGEPPVYGRFQVEIPVVNRSTNASMALIYWLNPKGSRNLEFDPAKYGNIARVPDYYLRPGTPSINDLERMSSPTRQLKH